MFVGVRHVRSLVSAPHECHSSPQSTGQGFVWLPPNGRSLVTWQCVGSFGLPLARHYNPPCQPVQLLPSARHSVVGHSDIQCHSWWCVVCEPLPSEAGQWEVSAGQCWSDTNPALAERSVRSEGRQTRVCQQVEWHTLISELSSCPLLTGHLPTVPGNGSHSPQGDSVGCDSSRTVRCCRLRECVLAAGRR